MNTTFYNPINTTMDVYNSSTYNTGCLDELQKLSAKCTTFKAEVQTIYGDRILIAMIVMFAIILFKIYIDNRKPQFSQTEFWLKEVSPRIDWIIILLMTGIMTILFLI